MNAFENVDIFKTIMIININRIKGFIPHDRIEKRSGSVCEGRIFRVKGGSKMKMMHSPLGKQSIMVEK